MVMRYHHVRFSGIKVNDQWQTYGTLHIWTMEAHDCTFGTQTEIERKNKPKDFDTLIVLQMILWHPLIQLVMFTLISVWYWITFLTPEVFVERMWWVKLYEVLLFLPCSPSLEFYSSAFSTVWSQTCACVCCCVFVCCRLCARMCQGIKATLLKHLSLSHLLVTQSLSLEMLYHVAWSCKLN